VQNVGVEAAAVARLILNIVSDAGREDEEETAVENGEQWPADTAKIEVNF
jgi:hypothetical protein